MYQHDTIICNICSVTIIAARNLLDEKSPATASREKKLRLCGLEGAHGPRNWIVNSPKNAKDGRRWSETLQDLWIFYGFQMKLHWFWILIMALGQVPCPSHPLQSTEFPRPWSPSCCDSNFLEPSWPDVGAWNSLEFTHFLGTKPPAF